MLPAPNATFSDANSEILPDGRVLCALVQGSLNGTIIYNPVTNAWTTGPNSIGIHNESAWVKLADDSILMVDRNTTNSERYMPGSNTWVADATVPVSLYDPYGLESGAGFRLPDGRAFYLGSTGHTALYTPSGGASAGTWAAGPDIPLASGTPDAPAAMLVQRQDPVRRLARADFRQSLPDADHLLRVRLPGELVYRRADADGRHDQSLLLLRHDARAAGRDGALLRLQQPRSTATSRMGRRSPRASRSITTVTQNANGSFHIVGTQLNGISEGSCYGDDNQNATNYPIVRLTSGTTVYHARSFNWSRTSVATGSTPVSTEFALPAGLPSGTYSLTVVANGISSDPVSLSVNPIQVTVPASATEGSAPVAASITLPSAPAADLTVTLSSTIPARATVPATVTVLAGQTTASFNITIIDDAVLNGAQAVGISAAATGYQTGLSYINVLDNDTAIISVTPDRDLFDERHFRRAVHAGQQRLHGDEYGQHGADLDGGENRDLADARADERHAGGRRQCDRHRHDQLRGEHARDRQLLRHADFHQYHDGRWDHDARRLPDGARERRRWW